MPAETKSSTPGRLHSPPPWKRADVYGSFEIVDANGFEVAEVARTAILPGWSSKLRGVQHWSDAPGRAFIERNPFEVEANSRLIVAAPDLYRLCTELLRNHLRNQPHHDPKVCDLCRQTAAALNGEQAA